MIIEVHPPQEVIDEHALIAQKYAGWLVGHPVQAERYTVPIKGSVHVDTVHPWVEPNPVQDTCVFCVRLTDAEAERRVFGMQAAIDKEVLARKWRHLAEWCRAAADDEVPVIIYHPDLAEQTVPTQTRNTGAMSNDFHNRRRFIELRQHMPTALRPNGWRLKAAPIVSLPLRLKRKMCIEWNHVYVRWMADVITYDFEKRAFIRDYQPTDPVDPELYFGD